MGKENRQGINVKPDQHGRICFLEGGGEGTARERGETSQSRFQSVNLNL